jgi:GNAT superfamily N-acetyltransferase
MDGQPAVEIRKEGPAALAEYAAIPSRLVVCSRLRVCRDDGVLRFDEMPVAPPYVKDYDAVGVPPAEWSVRWDVATWGVLLARVGEDVIGGAVVACRTPGPYELEDRDDLAALVDLRVAPAWQRHGVGSALFDATAHWARSQGCRALKIETQDVNVPACRFYAARGCRLGAVQTAAYAELPDETALLWYLPLAAVPT